MTDRKVQLAAGGVILLLGLLLGYLPQRSQIGALRAELAAAGERVTALEQDVNGLQQDLEAAWLGSRLGAALAESQRGNYERARQLMSSFYGELGTVAASATGETQVNVLAGITGQRDELITMLSRATPESTPRLALMFTQYFAVMDPHGQQAPTSLTPSPADTIRR